LRIDIGKAGGEDIRLITSRTSEDWLDRVRRTESGALRPQEAGERAGERGTALK